jgi:hypothetical protein
VAQAHLGVYLVENELPERFTFDVETDQARVFTLASAGVRGVDCSASRLQVAM